ncbi:MAG: hypothetical protein L3J67_06725 [Hyphomicrobiaceae bacterium]|nr:hypothetical protein [Hyphomicrobiaceae bacterium]
MCEFYDVLWQPALILLLFFSILTLLVRVKYHVKGEPDRSMAAPKWLAASLFWGSGIVGLTMLALMVLGFVCAGSSGDIRGIVPN